MATKVLILGESGSGKSTSIKTLDPKTTAIINVIGKPLPFKGWAKDYTRMSQSGGNMTQTYNYEKILEVMNCVDKKMPHIKTLIIDDAQYVMSFEFMDKARERGFDKFTDIGKHMFDILRAPDTMREDLIVVFLSHSEDVNSNGFMRTKMKTIGKMLDEKITIEGLFTVVLLTDVKKEKEGKLRYMFVTKSNGTTTAKSPEGMFETEEIDNDLKQVVESINKYNKGE